MSCIKHSPAVLVAYSVNIFQKKKKQIKHPSTEMNINLRGSVWREKKKKEVKHW